MVSPVRVVIALLLLGVNARAELHFNFQLQESDLDGVKLRELVFSDAGKRVTYEPPRGWQYFGDENALRLMPPPGHTGEGLVTRIKLAQPEKFDDVTMKRLANEVLILAPPGAKQVRLVLMEKNPLLIENKETFLVIPTSSSTARLKCVRSCFSTVIPTRCVFSSPAPKQVSKLCRSSSWPAIFRGRISKLTQ